MSAWAMLASWGDMLSATARRLHLVLDANGPWWTWARSGTTRRLVFERDKASQKGIEDMLHFIAPSNEEVETVIVIGH